MANSPYFLYISNMPSQFFHVHIHSNAPHLIYLVPEAVKHPLASDFSSPGKYELMNHTSHDGLGSGGCPFIPIYCSMQHTTSLSAFKVKPDVLL